MFKSTAHKCIAGLPGVFFCISSDGLIETQYVAHNYDTAAVTRF